MNASEFELFLQKGPEAGKVIPLSSASMVIGRDPLADITIIDPEVSRQHARLVSTLSGFQIQDLGSTNGTFIDGRRISGDLQALQPGQVITIGSGVALVFRATEIEDEQLATVIDRTPPPTISAGESDWSDFARYGGEPEAVGESEPAVEETSGEAGYDFGSEEAEPLPWPPAESTAVPPWQPPQADDAYDIFEQQGEPDRAAGHEPIVIPHEGQAGDDGSPAGKGSRRTLTIVTALVLLIVCCCCSAALFIYYYGGDWLLQQLGAGLP